MILTSLLLSTLGFAQEPQIPALSPKASVTQQVGIVDVTVTYSSPAKRDREIWGDLVPYGELWRTGANMATTFEVTGDVKIDGKDVPAGRYALFTIPGEETWTVILNKNPDQSGAGAYTEDLDLLRLEVKPAEAPERERMTFLFSDTDMDSTRLDLEWAGLRVSVPIEVDTSTQVAGSIDAFAKGSSGSLARAARYKLENGDLDGALKLIDASLALEQTWFNTFVKADILHQKGQNKDAYKLAQHAHELGSKATGFFWRDRVEQALAEWKKR